MKANQVVLACAVALICFACGGPDESTASYATDAGTPPTEGESAIPKFWQWFKSNSARLSQLVSEKPQEFVKQVTFELKRIHPDLVAEVGYGDRENKLFVSGGGLKSAFSWVEKTVDEAPGIDGWIVTAFRQPEPAITSVDYEGTKLSHEQVKFVILNSAPPVDIEFFIEGLSSQEDPKIGAAFLLLDALIGEYSTATKIGGMQWSPMSQAPPNARRFREILSVLEK